MRKLWCYLLGLVLVVGFLPGCGGDSGTESEEPPATGPQQDTAPDPGEPPP